MTLTGGEIVYDRTSIRVSTYDYKVLEGMGEMNLAPTSTNSSSSARTKVKISYQTYVNHCPSGKQINLKPTIGKILSKAATKLSKKHFVNKMKIQQTVEQGSVVTTVEFDGTADEKLSVEYSSETEDEAVRILTQFRDFACFKEEMRQVIGGLRDDVNTLKEDLGALTPGNLINLATEILFQRKNFR